MSFLKDTVLKDLRRFRRDPIAILMWIGIPLLIGGLLSLAVGGGDGPQPQPYVLIVDEDDSFVSGFIAQALNQGDEGFARGEKVDREEGLRRIDRGEASALLIIPPGFGQALLREEPTSLRLLKNPSQSVLPGMVEEALSMLSDGVFYLHRLVGDDLRRLAEGPPGDEDTFPDAEIVAVSLRVNQVMKRLSGYIDPLLIQLELPKDEDKDADAAPRPSFLSLFLPGILFMSLLFMAQGISEDLWKERLRETLKRAVVAPQSLQAFLAGKALAGLVMMMAVSLVALVAGYLYLGLSWGTLPVTVIWSAVSGLFLLNMMMLLQLLATTQRAGNVITLAAVFPLMMVGGSFFPFEAMPAWMAGVGRLTPNGWALARLKEIILGEATTGTLALGFVALLLLSALLVLLNARLMRRWVAA